LSLGKLVALASVLKQPVSAFCIFTQPAAEGSQPVCRHNSGSEKEQNYGSAVDELVHSFNPLPFIQMMEIVGDC
jgi:hypothetical protein